MVNQSSFHRGDLQWLHLSLWANVKNEAPGPPLALISIAPYERHSHTPTEDVVAGVEMYGTRRH